MKQFKLETFFSKHEFTAQYLLCASDAESFSMKEIIDMGSAEDQALWNNLRLGYTEDRGLPILREVIASELYQYLTKDDIICFAGAEDGIYCALKTICTEKDHAIVLTPCYQSLLEIPQSQKSSVTQIELLEDEEWKINISRIEKSIQPDTKIIIINFPHNPTGQVISQKDLDSLIAVCKKNDIWLFADEVYRLLGNPKDGWFDCAASCYDKAISLGVMSKAFGLPGLRVGWIACQNQTMLQKILAMKHYTTICNSAPSEILSLIALKNKDKLLERNNQIVKTNLNLLDKFFTKYNKFSWVRSNGGCIGFVKYSSPERVEDFCTKLVDQTGVLLMPSSIYNMSTNHFRVGFGRKNMPDALDKLEKFIMP